MDIRTIIIALVLSVLGCTSLLGRVPQSQMAPRLSYQGFSFDRPGNKNWYMLRSEESHTDVFLRRDFLNPSKTHTFYANISLGGIERQPKTHEEFGELVRSTGQKAPYEVKTASYDQRLVTKQNQWCVRFESSHVVIGSPQAPDCELTMILRGYRCLHPNWPKVTLDFFYSERGLPNEIDQKFTQEGEEFLNGVRIDIALNTPAK